MSKIKQRKKQKKNDNRKVSIQDRVAAIESRLDAITHSTGGKSVAGQASDGSVSTV